MKAKFISKQGTWRDVADAANETIGKEAGTKEPPPLWKKRILLSEHSPIRIMSFTIRFIDLMSWVSVHLVRHFIGIVHFVKTQRPDITGKKRNELLQTELITHRFVANPQALINISRKRLCNCASPETREAWAAALETIRYEEPEIFAACVRDCIYRGYCYQFRTCGYHRTKEFECKLTVYRSMINLPD